MGRILLADDDNEMASALEDTLRRAGFSTLRAVDGYDALSKVRNERFDLIITDINMPRCSGVEFIDCMQKQEDDRALKCPIIISSGFINDDVFEKYKHVKRVHFMPKPVQGIELRNKVAALLNRPIKKATLDARILNTLVKATSEGLGGLLNVTVDVGAAALKKTGEVSGDVSALVGVASESSFRGSIALSLSEPAFCSFFKALKNNEITRIDQENSKLMLEILNVIVRKAGQDLACTGVSSLVAGKGHSINHNLSFPTVAISFECQQVGRCRLEICGSY